MAPVDLRLPDLNCLEPYQSDDKVMEAKLDFLSYKYNPRNLEHPVYGAQSIILHTLDRCCAGLRTHPQYIISCPRAHANAMVHELQAKRGPTPSRNRAQPPRTAKTAATSAGFNYNARGRPIAGKLEKLQDYPELDSGLQTEVEEEVDKAEEKEENSSIDWDKFSSASVATLPDNAPVTGIPDFVQVHSIVIDLRALRNQQVATAGPETPAQKSAREEAEAKIRHFAAAHVLYNGKLLLRKAVFFMEEDKRGPSRQYYKPNHEKWLEAAYEIHLGVAQNNLLQYLFIYFYLIDVHATNIVCRAVSGAFWRWANFHRSDIPFHCFDGDQLALPTEPTDLEQAQLKAIDEKWIACTVREVGTPASDRELTRMRDRVLRNIEADSPKKREGVNLVY
ncbi:hypothetical protein EV122DRAFT_284455 [Schizophyllum commune]